jgi:hypothetical protein
MQVTGSPLFADVGGEHVGSSIAAKWPPWSKSVQRVEVFCSSAVATNADVLCEDDCGWVFRSWCAASSKEIQEVFVPTASCMVRAVDEKHWCWVGFATSPLSITSGAFAAKREPRLTDS